MNDTAPTSIITGFVLWALLFFLMWLGGRAQRSLDRAREVSRNKARHSGPSWEQDAPFPECFQDDTEQEDDL